jgi:hypothetical protein
MLCGRAETVRERRAIPPLPDGRGAPTEHCRCWTQEVTVRDGVTPHRRGQPGGSLDWYVSVRVDGRVVRRCQEGVTMCQVSQRPLRIAHGQATKRLTANKRRDRGIGECVATPTPVATPGAGSGWAVTPTLSRRREAPGHFRVAKWPRGACADATAIWNSPCDCQTTWPLTWPVTKSPVPFRLFPGQAQQFPVLANALSRMRAAPAAHSGPPRRAAVE